MYFDAMSSQVTVQVDAGIAVLTLNRPEQLNAYTADMGAHLSRAYRDCDNDDDVRLDHNGARQVAALETQLHHRLMGAEEAREGVAAVLERRHFTVRLSPEWTPLPEPEA